MTITLTITSGLKWAITLYIAAAACVSVGTGIQPKEAKLTIGLILSGPLCIIGLVLWTVATYLFLSWLWSI